MSNAQFMAATCLVLAAHLVALALAFTRWRTAAIRACLLAAAAAILAYLAWHPRLLRAPFDGQVWALLGFALVSAAAALAAGRARFARVLCWAAFALQLAASLAAVVFAFTFRITRLF